MNMFVVTLPSSAANNPLAFAKKAKKAGADILEIRGDLTPMIKAFKSPLPLLVSPRGTGTALINRLKPEYVDLDLKEAGMIPVIPDETKLIISHHDCNRTLSLPRLKKIVQRMSTINSLGSRYQAAAKTDSFYTRVDTRSRGMKIWAIKIATRINSYRDLKTLEDLRVSLGKHQRSIILGMGIRAHLNRMLSPLRDAFTYSFMDEGEEAAEGQVPLSMYRLTAHCKRPKLFGLLGSTDVRSKSPLIHNTLFMRHNIDALYCLCLTDDLADAWKNLTTLGLEGFSVTSPWKRAIIAKLDRLGAEHANAVSVNTAVKKRGKWIGYPRDAEGLMRGYPFLQHAKTVAILGSGGVVPEVIRACRLSGGGKDITVYARNQQARDEIAKRFDVSAAPLQSLPTADPDVLICAIPQNVPVALPKASKGSQAIDLRYGRTTVFMRAAAKKGYCVYDGLPMLIHQALAQFQLFTGISLAENDGIALEEAIHSTL